MKRADILRKALSGDVTSVRADLIIKAVDTDEHIVYGEVYAPNIIDTHGEMMLAEDVRLLAHRFLSSKLNDRIDIMHDNVVIDATVVESFIARKGDPDYTEGAWVLVTKINDEATWNDAKRGKLAGYSLEAKVRKQKADVEITITKNAYGYTEKYADHDHAFFLEIGDDGRVAKGYTSIDAGHFHAIKAGTATEGPDGDFDTAHSHRFFLP